MKITIEYDDGVTINEFVRLPDGTWDQFVTARDQFIPIPFNQPSSVMRALAAAVGTREIAS